MINQDQESKENLDQELNEDALEGVQGGQGSPYQNHNVNNHVLENTNNTPACETVENVMHNKETDNPGNS